MGKRTFILRISAAWVAVFVLLLGAPALAEQTYCTFKDGLTRGNWTLEKDAGGGEWPAPNAGLYDYKYKLTIPSSPSPLLPAGTIPSVDFLIPVCTPSLNITGTEVAPPSTAGNPPGVGARFGSWTGHDQVVRVKGVRVGTSNVYTIKFSTPAVAVLPLRDVSAGLVTNSLTATPYTCKDIVAPVCPGTSTPSAQGPIRSFESFQLGDTNCLMDIALNPDESIANASVHPFDSSAANPCADAQLTIESIRKALICQNDGNGQPVPGSCKPKTFVEQNIIDKSGSDSTYCYYTKTGSRVCKTL